MLELSIFGVVQRLLTRHALIRWANVGSLAFMLGCGASQKAHETARTSKNGLPPDVAKFSVGYDEYVKSISRLQEVMFDWSAEPASVIGPCTWAGVWSNRPGLATDHLLSSEAGVTVYGNRLLTSEIAITETTTPRLSLTSIWPVKGRFTTQGTLYVQPNQPVDLVPGHVWVDAHGSICVQSRTEDRVTIGFRGIRSKQVACSDLDPPELHVSPPVRQVSRVDGHLRDFILHAAPDGEVVMRQETELLPPALRVTSAVTVMATEGTWVHVRDARSVYKHFDG